MNRKEYPKLRAIVFDFRQSPKIASCTQRGFERLLSDLQFELSDWGRRGLFYLVEHEFERGAVPNDLVERALVLIPAGFHRGCQVFHKNFLNLRLTMQTAIEQVTSWKAAERTALEQ